MISRRPGMPARSAISKDDLEDYELMARRVAGYSASERHIHPKETSAMYFSALANSPAVAAAMTRLGAALNAAGGKANGWTHADHEFIDLVLSFDTGYLGLLAMHIPSALAAGVRFDAIVALRDQREEDLTDEESSLVRYIRSVISGTVTDDLWLQLQRRFGNAQSVIEYSVFILFLNLHVRMHQAMCIPSISPDELDELLTKIRDGTWPLPSRPHYDQRTPNTAPEFR
jgi:hypothetical protein